MLDQKELFHHIAEENQLLFFAYSVSAGEVLYVNDTYERMFAPAQRATVDADLPGLLRCIPSRRGPGVYPDLPDPVGGRRDARRVVAADAAHPGSTLRWLCVRARRTVASAGQVLLCGTVQDVTVEQEYTRNADKFMAKKQKLAVVAQGPQLWHVVAGPCVLDESVRPRCF